MFGFHDIVHIATTNIMAIIMAIIFILQVSEIWILTMQAMQDLFPALFLDGVASFFQRISQSKNHFSISIVYL